MSQEQQAYISRVHLKGYKSIKDLEIDLRPGLNIVIGPNGSGKSNFVDFMSLLNRFGYENELYSKRFESNITIKEVEDTIDLQIKSTLDGKDFKVSEREDWRVSGNFGQLNYNFLGSRKNLRTESWGFPYLKSMNTKKIGFDNPLNSISSKASITFIKDIVTKSTLDEIESMHNTQLDGFIALMLYLWSKQELITGSQNFIDDFYNYLPIYTPIKEIKLERKLIVSQKEGEGAYAEEQISNLINALKFKVNNNWHNWDELSDGTKRIFYLLVEMTNSNRLVLIEEPELGIHPDQLSLLMDLILEQAKEKQIIITTHAPIILNHLKYDELDRIIVTKYLKNKGTIMHRMNAGQIERAVAYMNTEGLWLSTYWVHADLENDIYETI